VRPIRPIISYWEQNNESSVENWPCGRFVGGQRRGECAGIGQCRLGERIPFPRHPAEGVFGERWSRLRIRGFLRRDLGRVGDFSLSIGYTGYFYTGDFDDTYQEINLGGAFAGLSLDVAIGEYENFAGPTQDYTFAALTFEHEGFYGTYGTFSQDFDGAYIELGYGTTIAEIDFGVALILADDDLLGGEDDESLIFTIGKSFDL
jgi:hypothetical protein